MYAQELKTADPESSDFNVMNARLASNASYTRLVRAD
jgi:hypothetical protein